MGNRGAPEGNTNASSKNRIVGDTLRKVAAQNPEKLRKACEKLLDKAVEGDNAAFSVFRDTSDGKPAQMIQGPADDGSFLVTITSNDESAL